MVLGRPDSDEWESHGTPGRVTRIPPRRHLGQPSDKRHTPRPRGPPPFPWLSTSVHNQQASKRHHFVGSRPFPVTSASLLPLAVFGLWSASDVPGSRQPPADPLVELLFFSAPWSRAVPMHRSSLGSSSCASFSSDSYLPGEPNAWNMILDLSFHYNVGGILREF